MAVGGPSRPTHSRLAPWVVTRRIKGRFAASAKPVPADFEATFIAIGRLACEEHYSVGDNTVTGWLEACGKERLIELRRQHVRQRKSEARIGRTRTAQVERMEAESNAALGIPDPLVAARAADFLRIQANGGWMISRTATGNWWVGTVCRTSGSMIAMAIRNGFDPATATLRGEGQSGVGSAR